MKMMMFRVLAGAALGLAPLTALAHATLERPHAPAGESYKAVIRIGHGCDGKATHTLRVTIPDGLYGVHPMPKAGWTLKTVKGPYAQPWDNHGEKVTEGVREVVWSGGDLPDEWYDEFVLRGTIGADVAPGTMLYLPTVQECDGASNEWTDVSGNPEAAKPAPAVMVVAPGKGGHGGHGHHHGAGPAGADHAAMMGGHQAHQHGAMQAGTDVAAPVTLGDLTLEGGFTRATPPGAQVGGGFVTITNGGDADDRLVSASSPVAGHVEIHEMAMEGDVMRMRELPDGLPIPAGEAVELKPGGYHLMFMELKKPLVEGETVPVTLVFEKSGEVQLDLPVGPMKGGKGAGHASH